MVSATNDPCLGARVFRNRIPKVSLTVAALLWGHAEAIAAEVKAYPECTTEPAESDINAAKGAFQAGQASFNEADYERAITYWEDAFRRDCTASALLLNLARAYELNGNRKQAVEALETYLARNPEAAQKDKTQITRRIEVLNRQIEQEEKKQAAAAAPEPTATPGQPEGSKTAPATTTTAPAEQQPANDSYWIGPVILGGAGAVAAVVGPFVWLSGKGDEDDADKECPTRRDCAKAVEQLGNDGIFKEKLGAGLVIGGLAAVGGAFAWYMLAKPEPAPSSAPPAAGKPPAGGGTSPPSLPSSPATQPAPAPTPPANQGAQSSMVIVPVVGDGFSGLSVLGTF